VVDGIQMWLYLTEVIMFGYMTMLTVLRPTSRCVRKQVASEKHTVGADGEADPGASRLSRPSVHRRNVTPHGGATPSALLFTYSYGVKIGVLSIATSVADDCVCEKTADGNRFSETMIEHPSEIVVAC
jgi:hypothetical protein